MAISSGRTNTRSTTWLTTRTNGLEYPAMAEQWLTYQQAGDLLGMSAEAARQRARRLKWRTQRGNDGRALVLVPKAPDVRPRIRPAVQPPGQTPVQPPVQTPGQTGDDSALAALLREHLERAEAIADTERARAERAEAALEAARIATARAEGEAAALREQIQAVERQLEAVRAEGEAARLQAARAEEKVEGLRLALEEARRPFWRRWIG